MFVRRCVRYVVVGIFFFIAQSVYAADASLFLLPDTGVYSIGDEFPVTINIDTDGATITAVGGSVQFNNEQLEVVSISTTNSIVSSWIPQDGPEYSDETGVISFEGFISGGYEGDRGTIAEVTFRALQNVTSQVRFQGGSAILAADEKATNILTQMNSGAYTLNPEEVTPQLEYVAQQETDTSVITSSTHPDQNMWYQATTSSLSWEITDDIEAVRLLFNDEPTDIPTIFYADPISERTIEDIEEGVWYFHLQTQNDAGWGEVSHFRIQVDHTNPESLNVAIQEREDPTDPTPTLELEAFDAMSGIRGFEVSVDGEPTGAIVRTEGTSSKAVYEVPYLEAGEHTLKVRAIDYAGNSIEDELSVSVMALTEPTVTSLPQNLTTSGLLTVKGTAIPNNEVRMFISKDGGEWSERRILANADGSFVFVMEETPEEGTYLVKFQARNSVGALSAETSPVEIVVTKPGLELYGGIVLGYLTIIVPLVGLVMLLIAFVWYGWVKARSFRRRIGKEVTEAEDTLHKEFGELKTVIEKEIQALEKAQSYRKLTSEEARILRTLRGEVREAHEAVQEEFDDVREVAEGGRVRNEFEHKVHGYVQKKKAPTEPRSEEGKARGKMQLRVEKLH